MPPLYHSDPFVAITLSAVYYSCRCDLRLTLCNVYLLRDDFRRPSAGRLSFDRMRRRLKQIAGADRCVARDAAPQQRACAEFDLAQVRRDEQDEWLRSLSV